MSHEQSPFNTYLQLEDDMRTFQLGKAKEVGLSGKLQENYSAKYKKKLLQELAEGKVDPELRARVGTADFFARALDITWFAHRDSLGEWERGNGEGRAQLLRNIMKATEEERLPSLGEVVRFADDVSLPTGMLDTLLVAGGYDQAKGMLGIIRTAHPSLERRDTDRFAGAMRELTSSRPSIGAMSRIALICLGYRVAGFFRRDKSRH